MTAVVADVLARIEAPPLGGASSISQPEAGAASAQAGHPPADDGFIALCLAARLHHIAADPESLAHSLGKSRSEPVTVQDILLAAKHLGLKAKLSRTAPDRLGLVPLPALALMGDGRVVLLAQCDGKRVLFLDPSVASGNAGAVAPPALPTIEPLDTFSAAWSGRLILIASRASIAGALAKFDFSWFIPSIVKYRRLFGEVLVISLFLQLFALVSPLFFQVVMDKVLVHRGLTTLDVLVIGLSVVVLFESLLTLLRTYVVDNVLDVVTENLNEGIDIVQASVTYTLGANAENLVLAGAGLINGTGNALANVLTGNSANNVLDGGLGDDTMAGGLGSDTYVVDSLLDVVSENINEGTDTVQASLTYTIGANLENLTLIGAAAINGTGNGANNVLTGNAAANVLDGSTGADTMAGGLGNDIYVVDNTGDVTTEAAAAGTDLVQSSITWTLGANLENLTLTGAAAINGTGNVLDNVLTGNAAANRLTGSLGNDTLDGGAGNDTLVGGVGSDTYIMGRGYGADLVQENDATIGNTDVMKFLAGVTDDQIWLRHVGNDLEVSIIGTTDKATLQNWYGGVQYHVEQFRTSDGHLLLDSNVQNLVNAMAAFAPPGAGQTTLPPAYQTALNPVIAANWGP